MRPESVVETLMLGEISPVNPTPDGDLTEAFADITRRLHGESSSNKVHDRIGRAAVHTVGGCDHAAISSVDRHRAVDTVGATDDVPKQVDAIQYEVGQRSTSRVTRSAPSWPRTR